MTSKSPTRSAREVFLHARPSVRVARTVVVGADGQRGYRTPTSEVVAVDEQSVEVPRAPLLPAEHRPEDALMSPGTVGPRHDPPSGPQPLMREDARWFSVFDAVREIPVQGDLAKALAYTLDLLSAHVPCDAAGAAVYDAPAHRMRYVAAAGPLAEGFHGRVIDASLGLLGQALRGAQRLRVAHGAGRVRGYLPDVDGCPGVQTRNLVHRPLMLDGRPVALLHFVNRLGPLSFSDTELDLIDYVGEQCALRIAERDVERCG